MSPDASFKQVLAEWRYPSVNIPVRPVLLERAVQRVLQQFSDIQGVPQDPVAIDETRRILKEYWERNKLDELPRVHLRRSPHVLFSGPEPQLGANEQFIRAYLALLQRRGNSRIVGSLLHAFLRDYPVGHRTFDLLWEGLRRLLMERPVTPRLQLWKERCTQYGFLDADGVPRFALAWLSYPGSASSYLVEAGLSGELSTRGFVGAVFDHLLHVLSDKLARASDHSPDLLDSVLSIALHEENKLRFPDRRARLAEALLLPFRDSHQVPAGTDRIREFLTLHYGHPRIKLANWQGVHSDAVQVFLRWSVREALDTFFDVLDETAKASHWWYRKAFWTAYLERGYIDDAWIFLGRHARSLASRRLHELKGSYGIYRGGQANQSVLAMKIGGLTITEHTHDGSCRIWPANHPRAPRLYQAVYERIQGWDAPVAIRHTGQERGSWQSAVARYIYDHTGIAVDPLEYMPTRQHHWG